MVYGDHLGKPHMIRSIDARTQVEFHKDESIKASPEICCTCRVSQWCDRTVAYGLWQALSKLLSCSPHSIANCTDDHTEALSSIFGCISIFFVFQSTWPGPYGRNRDLSQLSTNKGDSLSDKDLCTGVHMIKSTHTFHGNHFSSVFQCDISICRRGHKSNECCSPFCNRHSEPVSNLRFPWFLPCHDVRHTLQWWSPWAHSSPWLCWLFLAISRSISVCLHSAVDQLWWRSRWR